MPALVRDFIVFEDDGGGALVKKMAGYHQFHAVQTAVAETLRAAALRQAVADDDAHGRSESGRRPGGTSGDRRIGVVWHTQGAGKSLTMAFYAGRIVREPESWNARTAPERVAYIDLANTKWGQIERVEIHSWRTAPSRARRVLRAGDTIVGAVRPENGSFALIGCDGLTGST